MKRNLFIVASLLMIASFACPELIPKTHAAADASLSFSPLSTTVANGSTFKINIMINPGSNQIANGDLVVNYDSSKMTLNSIATTDGTLTSPFSSVQQSDINNGTANYGANTPFGTTVTTTSLFATLNFTANASGSSSIDVGNLTAFYADNDPGVNELASINVSTTVTSTSPATYTVGGTISGLTGASSPLVLQLNAPGNEVSTSANGAFTFPTALDTNTGYGVSVKTQPTGKTCSVTGDPSGSAPGSGNITDVAVTCTDNPIALTITSIARQNPLQQSTNSPTATFRITFSKPVLNVTPDDFVLTGPAAAAIISAGSGAQITAVSSSIYDYSITRTYEGSLYLSVSGSQNIADASDSSAFVPSGANGIAGTNEQYDFHGPAISNIAPASTLAAGTTQTNITFDTDVASICKYDTNSGTNYALMPNVIESVASTSHTFAVVGLTDGSSRGFWVKCADANGMFNITDRSITVSVASAPVVIPPVPVIAPSADNSNDSKNNNSSHKKEVTKPNSVSNSKKSVQFGSTLVQRGKKFSKNTFVMLYFSKKGGGYYPPMKVKTSSTGAFMVTYKVNKPKGIYGWYAVDTKTGKKSKLIFYKVR